MKKKDKLLIALGAIILSVVLTVVGSNIYFGNWISGVIGAISSIVLMYAMFRYIKVVSKLNKWDVCVYMHSAGQVAEAKILLSGLGEAAINPLTNYNTVDPKFNYLRFSRDFLGGSWFIGVQEDLTPVALAQLPEIIKNSDV